MISTPTHLSFVHTLLTPSVFVPSITRPAARNPLHRALSCYSLCYRHPTFVVFESSLKYTSIFGHVSQSTKPKASKRTTWQSNATQRLRIDTTNTTTWQSNATQRLCIDTTNTTTWQSNATHRLRIDTTNTTAWQSNPTQRLRIDTTNTTTNSKHKVTNSVKFVEYNYKFSHRRRLLPNNVS
jgi:hypothetical protein